MLDQSMKQHAKRAKRQQICYTAIAALRWGLKQKISDRRKDLRLRYNTRNAQRDNKYVTHPSGSLRLAKATMISDEGTDF